MCLHLLGLEVIAIGSPLVVVISVSIRVVLTPNIHNNVTAFQYCWVSGTNNPEMQKERVQQIEQCILNTHIIMLRICLKLTSHWRKKQGTGGL